MELLRLGEVHDFRVGSKRYLFSAPSLAIAELDEASTDVIDCLREKWISCWLTQAAMTRSLSPSLGVRRS